MKVSSPRATVSMRDFRLLFTVRSIIFHRQRPLPIRIYLEKDVQIIGVVPELIPALPAGTHRSFSEFTQPIEFRMAGERANTYSVSLYEVGEERESHLETSELKFSKFLEEYCREFQELEAELGSQMHEKDKGGLAKTWKTLCARFTKRIYTSAVRFGQSEGLLEFALEPLHPFDEAVREADQAEQLRHDRKERKQEIYKKSRTIPDAPQTQDPSPLRRGATDVNRGSDSDLTLVEPFEFQSRKHLSPSKRTQSSKSGLLKENQSPKVSLKGKDEVLSNIAEVSDSLLSFANSNKTNQVLGQTKKQKFIELPIMRITQKRPSAQEEPPERGVLPIQTQERWLISATSKPQDMLEIQSGIELKRKMQQRSNLKTQMWNGAFLVASMFGVYMLMHPLSRV